MNEPQAATSPATTELRLRVSYNGLIHPLVPYALRGVIWYQGESNMGDGLDYYPKMQALIEGWRKAWGQGDFPFYFVQLPPYGGGPGLPLIREAQRATLAVPNTGMAVTIDSQTRNSRAALAAQDRDGRWPEGTNASQSEDVFTNRRLTRLPAELSRGSQERIVGCSA